MSRLGWFGLGMAVGVLAYPGGAVIARLLTHRDLV